MALSEPSSLISYKWTLARMAFVVSSPYLSRRKLARGRSRKTVTDDDICGSSVISKTRVNFLYNGTEVSLGISTHIPDVFDGRRFSLIYCGGKFFAAAFSK